ncbi:hypothetical protein [Mesorhizobium sp. M0220]|uniref:hypothetical protein n=1 Tax=Mesorhizobium sp. M0220 TaxID=2956920 RepID=UPI003337E5C5
MLRDFGVSISKRQVVRILTGKIDAFVAEAKQVLTAGLASAGWVSVDDTGPAMAREWRVHANRQ